MSTTTIRPNSTVGNGSSTVTGAATRHGALLDDSDSSYVTFAADDVYATLGFPSPTIPAGADVKSVLVRTRSKSTSLTSAASLLRVNAALQSDSIVVNWKTPTTTWILGLLSSPLQVQLAAASQGIRIYELYIDVVYVAKPVVTVTAPLTPLTEDNQPEVVWETVHDVNADAGRKYEVRIFTDAQYGAGGFDPLVDAAYAESGEVEAAATSWTPSVTLPNDTYRAYVREASQSDDDWVWSDQDYIEFVVDVDLPAVPDLSVTPEDDDGRVRIYLDSNAGDATTDGWEVQRYEDGEWQDVRTIEGDGRVSSSAATILDYEAFSGEPVTYRARAFHTYTATDAYSDWITDTTTLNASWWLKHPTDPSLNRAVTIREFEVGSAARVTVKQPLSGSAVALSDTRGPASGSVTFFAEEDTALRDLQALAATVDPLLVSAGAGDNEPNRWVVLGDESITRLIDKQWGSARDLTYSWTEVARPDGAISEWDDNFADYFNGLPSMLQMRFDETAGTEATDISGRGIYGTYVGSPTLGVEGILADGNTAVDLNGSTQYVTTTFGAHADAYIDLGGRENHAPSPSFDTYEGWLPDYRGIHGDLPDLLTINTTEPGIPNGTNCLQIDANRSGTDLPGDNVGLVSQDLDVDGGQDWVWSCYFKAPVGRTLKLGVHFKDEDNVLVQNPTTDFVETGAWQRISVSEDVDASVTRARIYLVERNSTSPLTFYVNGPLFEPASSLGSFFDENTGGASVVTGTNAAFDPGSGRTFVTLFKRASHGAVMALFGGDVALKGPILRLSNANPATVQWLPDGVTISSWADVVPTGEWVLAILAHNDTANEASLYIGTETTPLALVATNTGVAEFDPDAGALKVGAQGATTGSAFDGIVDEFVVVQGIIDPEAAEELGALAFEAS